MLYKKSKKIYVLILNSDQMYLGSFYIIFNTKLQFCYIENCNYINNLFYGEKFMKEVLHLVVDIGSTTINHIINE